MEQTMEKQSLYHIQQEHLSLVAAIEDNEGILEPWMQEALQLSEEAIQAKGLSYGWVIRKFMNESDLIDKEIKRLRAMKDKTDHMVELIKDRLSEGMKTFGIEKIESPTLKLSFRKSESVEITDESKIPFAYVEEKVVKSISKAKIKDDLKAGCIVPGAHLQTNQNLQIK